MNKYFFVSVLSYTLSYFINASGQDCGSLANGKYKVKFNKEYKGESFILQIEGNHFTEIRNGQISQGDILMNEDCILKLDRKIKLDTTNHLQKIFQNSIPPYFILNKTKENKIIFRLTGYGGPHVTAGEGVFIRVN